MKDIDPLLLERLAEDLAQMHTDTAIELENWDTALEFVNQFYYTWTTVVIGAKKK